MAKMIEWCEVTMFGAAIVEGVDWSAMDTSRSLTSGRRKLWCKHGMPAVDVGRICGFHSVASKLPNLVANFSRCVTNLWFDSIYSSTHSKDPSISVFLGGGVPNEPPFARHLFTHSLVGPTNKTTIVSNDTSAFCNITSFLQSKMSKTNKAGAFLRRHANQCKQS